MVDLPPPLLDARSFTRIQSLVTNDLHQRLTSAAVPSTAAALDQSFVLLFGSNCSRRDRLRFLLFAAPIARRIMLELVNVGDRIGDTDVTIADIKQWLWWQDAMDPLCARMIDLHYFADLPVRDTAAVLELPPHAVIRDLRFAKAWLAIRLPPDESQTESRP